jgi:cytochrome c
MKSLFVVAAAASMVSIPAFANQELAQRNGCLTCHGVDKKIVGPAFKEIAKKYADDNLAPATLFAKVRMGGRGVWGDVPMPPNPQVSDADLKQIIGWVLTLK